MFGKRIASNHTYCSCTRLGNVLESAFNRALNVPKEGDWETGSDPRRLLSPDPQPDSGEGCVGAQELDKLSGPRIKTRLRSRHEGSPLPAAGRSNDPRTLAQSA